MVDVAISQNQANLKDYILSTIINDVDRLLSEDKNTAYSENPIVDIEAIALKAGLIILPALSDDISNKHAEYKEITIISDNEQLEKKHVILVKDHDCNEEKRFSIAHEIYHYLKSDKSGSSRDDTTPFKMLNNKRFISDYILLEINETGISKSIAKDATEILGKRVCEKKARAVFSKAVRPVYEKIGKVIFPIFVENKNFDEHKKKMDFFQKEMKSAITTAIKETINEEIADYFAANLIVPAERFLLWEDKPDEEIARAFGVTEKCIRKRREEIVYELEFISRSVTCEELNSGVNIEEMPSLTLNDLNQMMEGYNSNAPG